MKRLFRQSTSLFVVEDRTEFIALNKPANTHSIPLEDQEQDCFSSQVLKAYPDLGQASDKPLNAGFISRLDYETSGLIIAAKTSLTWNLLRSLGASNKITKTYLAVLSGKSDQYFTVNASIGSRYRRSKKVSCLAEPTQKKFRAQPAETKFSLVSYNKELNISLVEARIHIGRRHQIRAHAAFSDLPLVGDELYGHKDPVLCEDVSFLLHSQNVEFELNGQQHSVSAPLPDYFERVVAAYF